MKNRTDVEANPSPTKKKSKSQFENSDTETENSPSHHEGASSSKDAPSSLNESGFHKRAPEHDRFFSTF